MGVAMETVSISPDFQITLPPAIRESLKLYPGQKLQVIQHGERIELIPTRSAREMRGFAKGIDTSVEREPDRV